MIGSVWAPHESATSPKKAATFDHTLAFDMLPLKPRADSVGVVNRGHVELLTDETTPVGAHFVVNHFGIPVVKSLENYR